MKRASLVLVLVMHVAPAWAAPWTFDPPQTVSEPRAGVFHHLDPAGRRGIAVSAGIVAIVWEDNRGGNPGAYVAFRKPSAPGFRMQKLSSGGEAYEVVVAALPNGRFIFGWEENGSVQVRTGTAERLDSTFVLSRDEANQITLDADAHVVHAAWSERTDRHASIRYARFKPNDLGKPIATVAVSPPPAEDQLYPSLAILPDRVWVAWEDRSQGHTRILAAVSKDGRSFAPAQRINRMRSSGRRQVDYGRGPGATRVALTAIDGQRAAAVWLDKRDFQGGYDVFTALTDDAGAEFGVVEPVQDEFGANIGQWHAGIASHPNGTLVCVWDDDRDGSPDIQLSWRSATGWSPNLSVPGANGPGQETSPVITLDPEGDLHMAWVERERSDGPTRVRYLRGRRVMP
jgi:hypothetical protein